MKTFKEYLLEGEKYYVLFDFQDKNQEVIIHDRNIWGNGQNYRYVLEGVGDIFRELTKDYPIIGYIKEKLIRAEKFIKSEKVTKYSEVRKANMLFPETMDKLKDLWDKQPYETELQKNAIDLNLAFLNEDWKTAEFLMNKIETEVRNLPHNN
jgi:hypothetical protein